MTQVQGMTITCLEGWLDKSMLVLGAAHPGPTGVSPSFVITREMLPDDPAPGVASRLHDFVERQIGQMQDVLPGVAVTRRQASGSWVDLRIDSLSDGIALTQSITYADAGDDNVMIATGTAARADFDGAEPVFRTMLQSFRIV